MNALAMILFVLFSSQPLFACPPEALEKLSFNMRFLDSSAAPQFRAAEFDWSERRRENSLAQRKITEIVPPLPNRPEVIEAFESLQLRMRTIDSAPRSYFFEMLGPESGENFSGAPYRFTIHPSNPYSEIVITPVEGNYLHKVIQENQRAFQPVVRELTPGNGDVLRVQLKDVPDFVRRWNDFHASTAAKRYAATHGLAENAAKSWEFPTRKEPFQTLLFETDLEHNFHPDVVLARSLDEILPAQLEGREQLIKFFAKWKIRVQNFASDKGSLHFQVLGPQSNPDFSGQQYQFAIRGNRVVIANPEGAASIQGDMNRLWVDLSSSSTEFENVQLIPYPGYHRQDVYTLHVTDLPSFLSKMNETVWAKERYPYD